MALVIPSQAQSSLTNGLVAYYPFNGNASDASGNGNNGTVSGATLTQNMFGMSNSAYSFDGVSDYISIPDFPQADANQLTVSVWLKAYSWTNIPTPAQLYVDILGKDDYQPGTRQWVCQGTRVGQIRWAVFTSTGEYDLDSISELQTNQWYQVVMVWDGTNSSVYINGVFDSSLSAPGTLVQGNAPVRLGGNPVDVQEFLHGNMTDVRIYDLALSSDEVLQLFQNESAVRIALVQAVQPSFANLTLGTNYQLEISTDLNTWTNQGPIFTATNSNILYPQFFYVSTWNQLYFRLQMVP
jgi:hypothetical protein